jgi:hypothetical protein
MPQTPLDARDCGPDPDCDRDVVKRQAELSLAGLDWEACDRVKVAQLGTTKTGEETSVNLPTVVFAYASAPYSRRLPLQLEGLSKG